MQKKIDSLKDEDYRICDSEINVLNSLIEKSYACVPFYYILSFDTVFINRLAFLKHTNCSYYFMDNTYPMMANSSVINAFGDATRIDKDCYQIFSFFAVNECLNEYNLKIQKHSKNSILCFMENGYLEDGIDIVLESFEIISHRYADAILTIKIPNYYELLNKCYPRHNKESRFHKQFLTINKIKNDFIKLQQKILSLKIQDKVKLVEKNLSFKEILELINCNASLFNISRASLLPPHVFAAILMKKDVYIAESHNIIEPLKTYCEILKSSLCDFSEEFKVPKTCENLLFKSVKIERDVLLEKFFDESNMKITDDVVKEINDMALVIFERIKRINYSAIDNS